MDILFLNHNVAWSGGTFFRAFGFARELVRIGHRVTLLAIAPSARGSLQREKHEGVEIWYTPDLFWGRGRTGWDPWDVFRRLLALRGRRWDIVHAWDSRPAVILPALYAAASSRAAGGRLVIDWCDWWGRGGTQVERAGTWMRAIGPVETFFEEGFRYRADGTTVISEALSQRAASLGVSPRRTLLLPPGCDVSARPNPDRHAAAERLGLPRGSRLLVSVGALHRSDAELLFDAVRLVFNECPSSHFALVGNHGTQVPRDLRDHPRFRETGYVPVEVLHDYVQATHSLLVPLADTVAARARWPSKVNGFLAAARAVVITRVGDLPRLLEHEGAAVVVEPTAGDLCAGALRVLSGAERDRVEREGRRVAETILAWPIVAGRLDAFYDQIVGARARDSGLTASPPPPAAPPPSVQQSAAT
jgi:glycosyltransferase involved in cell wall biosynthesis